MKNRFIVLLEEIGYPYQRLNALQKKEVLDIHRSIFNRSESYYRDRTCSSCFVAMLNDLAIRFELPKVGELTTKYKERIDICKSCTAIQGDKVLTCGELGKPTKGRYPTCGCILNIKARIKGMHCPREKW